MIKVKVGDRVRVRYTNELGTVTRCTARATRGYRSKGFCIPSLPSVWEVSLDGGGLLERQDWRLRVVANDEHCCSWGACNRKAVYFNTIGGESVHFIPSLYKLVLPTCGNHAKEFLKKLGREGEVFDRITKEVAA